MGVIFHLFQIVALFHQFHDALARRETVEPFQLVDERFQLRRQLQPFKEIRVVLDCDSSVGRQNVNRLKIVAFADLEIVEVMRRRDLHRAGTGFGIGIIVGNNRNVATNER